jgi:hypothetical protein
LLNVQIVTGGGAIASVAGVDNVRYTTNIVAADITDDGTVGVPDLLAVINAWGGCELPCAPFCAADVTHDCTVGVPDLLAVINSWGACP